VLHATKKLKKSSSLFDSVLSIHCLAVLDLGVRLEQPFNCLIVQNHQTMQLIGRSMDWTFEDNMVGSLFFAPHSQAAEVMLKK